jgi:hypothetical protein
MNMKIRQLKYNEAHTTYKFLLASLWHVKLCFILLNSIIYTKSKLRPQILENYNKLCNEGCNKILVSFAWTDRASKQYFYLKNVKSFRYLYKKVK